MKLFLVSFFVAAASAFRSSPVVSRPTTHLNENFGLGVGEDTYSNQIAQLGGEANYKQWVNDKVDNSFLNRKVRYSFPFDLLLSSRILTSTPVLLSTTSLAEFVSSIFWERLPTREY